jgi:hypothetical protein
MNLNTPLKPITACFLVLALIACGDDYDYDIDEESYNEGYNAGQFDVCYEIRRHSAYGDRIADSLSNCDGY